MPSLLACTEPGCSDDGEAVVRNFVVIVVPDGPINLVVFGDAYGEPFKTAEEAEQAALAYRHHGTGYSVYVKELNPS